MCLFCAAQHPAHKCLAKCLGLSLAGNVHACWLETLGAALTACPGSRGQGEEAGRDASLGAISAMPYTAQGAALLLLLLPAIAPAVRGLPGCSCKLTADQSRTQHSPPPAYPLPDLPCSPPPSGAPPAQARRRGGARPCCALTCTLAAQARAAAGPAVCAVCQGVGAPPAAGG